MAFAATQYLLLATTLTATTTATSVGAYTVPASTRGSVIAMTISNSATSNITNYVDVGVFNGTFATPVSGTKTPIYPGGSFVVMGIEKHTLPTGGSIQVTPYATTGVGVLVSLIEVT